KTAWEKTEGHCWYCGMLTQLTDDRRVQFLAHAKGYRDNGAYLIIYPRQGEPSINHKQVPGSPRRHVLPVKRIDRAILMSYGQNIGTHYFREIYGLSLTLSSS